MLEETRKKGASSFIIVLFGILLLLFITNFGAQSQGGCSGGATIPMNVGASKVTQAAYQFAYLANEQQGGDETAQRLSALGSLVRRELLALEGERRGLMVSDTLLDKAIVDGWLFLGGERISAKNATHDKVNEEYFFNKEKFTAWASSVFRTSVAGYKQQQRRELLAFMAAQLLKQEVVVTRDEALAAWIDQNTSATIDAVVFSTRDARSALKLSEADALKWADANDAKLREVFEARTALYKGMPVQLRLRRIALARKPGAPADEDAALLKTLSETREAIANKKASFADAARKLTTRTSEVSSGGLVGWRSRSNATLGHPLINEAVAKLEPEQMTEVVTAPEEYVLVLAEAKREGDLSYEQVRGELALEAAGEAYAESAARRSAEAALASARAAAKPLAEVYPEAQAPVGRDPSQMSPEELQKLIEQLQANQAQSGIARERVEFASFSLPVAVLGGAAELPNSIDVAGGVKGERKRLTFGRTTGKIVGLGESKELMALAFGDLAEGALAPEIYKVEGGFAVVQLVNRRLADVAKFDSEAANTAQTLESIRAGSHVSRWLSEQCKALDAKKRIRINEQMLVTVSEKGERSKLPFSPCDYAR